MKLSHVFLIAAALTLCVAVTDVVPLASLGGDTDGARAMLLGTAVPGLLVGWWMLREEEREDARRGR